MAYKSNLWASDESSLISPITFVNAQEGHVPCLFRILHQISGVKCGPNKGKLRPSLIISISGVFLPASHSLIQLGEIKAISQTCVDTQSSMRSAAAGHVCPSRRTLRRIAPTSGQETPRAIIGDSHNFITPVPQRIASAIRMDSRQWKPSVGQQHR